jgi:hypothetical protein
VVANARSASPRGRCGPLRPGTWTRCAGHDAPGRSTICTFCPRGHRASNVSMEMGGGRSLPGRAPDIRGGQKRR